MIDFDKFDEDLRKHSNFAKDENLSYFWDIIKTTLKEPKHIMLIEDLSEIFNQTLLDEIMQAERAELVDFFKVEEEYR